MAKIITATFASSDTLKNVVDDLVNIGLPTEKIFANESQQQVKVISSVDIESEILEVVTRHNPTETSVNELKEKMTAKVITTTYSSADTLKNVVDDLVNIGLPTEEIFADEEKKEVKVITSKAVEAEIDEVLNRHNPTRIN